MSNEKGTATQGVKTNGRGDPRVHAPGVREEQAQTNGLAGAGSAKEIAISQNTNVPKGNVRKGDQDHYGVL